MVNSAQDESSFQERRKNLFRMLQSLPSNGLQLATILGENFSLLSWYHWNKKRLDFSTITIYLTLMTCLMIISLFHYCPELWYGLSSPNYGIHLKTLRLDMGVYRKISFWPWSTMFHLMKLTLTFCWPNLIKKISRTFKSYNPHVHHTNWNLGNPQHHGTCSPQNPSYTSKACPRKPRLRRKYKTQSSCFGRQTLPGMQHTLNNWLKFLFLRFFPFTVLKITGNGCRLFFHLR